MRELQSNNDSVDDNMLTLVSDEPLFLAPQKSEGNQGWYLKNDDENNEINESL